MSYLYIKLQYFENNIKKVVPIGELTLYQWLYSIKHPKESMMNLFREIEEASLNGDLKRKAELKSSLYYTVPASISDGKGRSYSNLKSFSGICVLDFDGLDVEYAKELKTHIFEEYQFVIASFLSSSKKGVKAIVKIPVVETVEEYKQLYSGLMSIFQYYKGIDFSASNAVLASYWSHDKELLYRLNASEWKGIGMRVDEFKVSDEPFEQLTDIDPKDVAGIKLMIKRMLDKIEVEQTAHLTIRSLGLLIGGWSAYGYFDYDEIQEEVLTQMDGIQFLHKSMRTYKTTFKHMMSLGSKSALKYDDER